MGGHQFAEFRERAGNVMLTPSFPGIRHGARLTGIRYRREPSDSRRLIAGHRVLVARSQIVRRQITFFVRSVQHDVPRRRRVVPRVAQYLLRLLVLQHVAQDRHGTNTPITYKTNEIHRKKKKINFTLKLIAFCKIILYALPRVLSINTTHSECLMY